MQSLQRNKSQEPLFNIDLKVAEQIVTLEVQNEDSIDDLLDKFDQKQNQNHQQGVCISMCPEKREKLRQKIVASIEIYLKQLEAKSIKLRLKENSNKLLSKVRNFLKEESKRQKPTSSNSKLNCDKYTPFKALQQKTQEKENMPTFFSKSQEKSEQKTINQVAENVEDKRKLNNKVKGSHPNSNKAPQENSRDSFSNKKLQSKTNPRAKRSSKCVDEDLICAYETILKKSKDKIMRQLAEKSLISILGPQYCKKKLNLVDTDLKRQKEPEMLHHIEPDHKEPQTSDFPKGNENMQSFGHHRREIGQISFDSNSYKDFRRPLNFQHISKECHSHSGKKHYSYTSFLNESSSCEPVSLLYQHYEEEKMNANTPYTYGHFESNGMYAQTSSFASLHKIPQKPKTHSNIRKFQYDLQ